MSFGCCCGVEELESNGQTMVLRKMDVVAQQTWMKKIDWHEAKRLYCLPVLERITPEGARCL